MKTSQLSAGEKDTLSMLYISNVHPTIFALVLNDSISDFYYFSDYKCN
jgi:hypothetical protein